GTSFTSKSFQESCNKYNIHHTKTAVRAARANGHVERINQRNLSYLRTTIEHPKDKDLTTGLSSNKLLSDYKLRDIVTKEVLVIIHDDLEDNTLRQLH
ncbi:unnamed protein product, partial [Ceratitis capitata]